ncbi:MAG: ATP-binding cassette domain-containing protein [Candidatus Methanodesulfokora sp.]
MSEAIVARELVKIYRTKKGRRKEEIRALDGVSFKAEKGEIFGLLGPNGAGKTTTVKILSTILTPDSGEAFIDGKSVLKEKEDVRKVIGVTFTVEKGFYNKLTGKENLIYFGVLRGMSFSDARRRADELLDLVGLSDDKNRLFEEYSLGMRAKLAIARTLMHDPPVLILDEPTIGLDPIAARNVRNLLAELRKEGKTILLTTHNMREAEELCDKISMIDRGRIILSGTVNELKRFVGGKIVVIDFLADIEMENTIKKDNGVSELRIECDKGNEMDIMYEALTYLRSKGARVIKAQVEEPSLEDVFVKVIRKPQVVA